MAGLPELNAWPAAEAQSQLLRCCGSSRWAAELARLRPFADEAALLAAADRVWRGLGRADWLEAFSHHPKIGGKDVLREKFKETRQWARGEQAGVAAASEDVLDALARGNEDYEKKFGYLFIVCATGKSAAEMLAILEARLPHGPAEELAAAAEEQRKITRIRLEKLLKP